MDGEITKAERDFKRKRAVLKYAEEIGIGVYAVPAEDIDTPDKLIQAADAALYEAKKKGKDRVEVKA